MSSAAVKHPEAKSRRDRLRDLKWCINGPFSPPGTLAGKAKVAHGPVVKAGKCARCCDVHSRKGRLP